MSNKKSLSDEQRYNRKVLIVRLVIIGLISLIAYASGFYEKVGLLVSVVFVGVVSLIFMLMVIPPNDES